MKRLLAAAILASALLAPVPAWATISCRDIAPTFPTATYYVCDCQTVTATEGTATPASGCTAGNDANNGTSTSTPFKTAEKARTVFTSMSRGSQVLFCMGGVWDNTAGNTSWRNTGCGNPSLGTTAPGSTQWCGLGTYVAPWNSGGEAMPWITHHPTFDLSNSSVAIEEQGYVFYGVHISADGNSAGSGVALYNDVDYVSMCGMKITGYTVGIGIGDDNGCGAGADGHSSHAHVSDTEIYANTGQGILGGDTDTKLLYVNSHDNGTRAGLDHNFYIGTAAICNTQAAITDILLDHVTSTRNDVSAGICTSAHLVSHGNSGNVSLGIPTVERFTVQYSTFSEPPGTQSDNCWGATADEGDNPVTGEWYSHFSVIGSTFTNLGNLSTGCGSCTDSLFENNVVVNGGNQGGVGIVVPDKGNETGANQVSTRTTIRNNSVYQDTGQCIEISEGTGHVLANNVCQINATGTVGGFRLPLVAAAYTSDYNWFFAPNATTRNFEQTRPLLPANWQSFSGGDSHSTCCTTNPGFKTPAYTSYDLSASTGSSGIVNAGSSSLGSTLDILGLGVSGSARDIGAYEFVSPAAAIGRAYLFMVGGGF